MQSRTRKAFLNGNLTSAGFLAFAAAAAVFVLINVPKVVEGRSSMENAFLLQIAEENRIHCEKWGMKFGTAEHLACSQDLQRIRDAHGRRIVDSAGSGF